jgi:DNA topoisomerase-1
MLKRIDNFPGLVAEQKFTTPPSRYSDASLSKKCENEQIARPATFGNFLKVLQDRGYIKREKKSFVPTDLGIKVIDFLVAADVCFVNIKFTADMESSLDDIQDAKVDKNDVLLHFWERLKKDIENGNKVKINNQKSTHKCPKCGGFLLKKHSQWGEFFSCENYKGKESEEGCKFTAKIDEHGMPIEKQKKEIEYMDFACKLCGSKMVKRSGKYGEFSGCSKYPQCKGVANLDGEFKEPKKKWKKQWNKNKDND